MNLFENVLAEHRSDGSDDAFSFDSTTRLRAGMKLDPKEERLLRPEYLDLIELFVSIREELRSGGDPWLESLVTRRARTAFRTGGEHLDDILFAHFADMANEARDPGVKISWLERALDLRPEPAIVRELALLYLQTNSAARGVERIRPRAAGFDDARCLNPWGVLLAASGEEDEAEVVFERALTRAGDARLRAEIHANLGYALLRVGRAEAARQHLEEALRLDPGQASARTHLEQLEAAVEREHVEGGGR